MSFVIVWTRNNDHVQSLITLITGNDDNLVGTVAMICPFTRHCLP